MNYRICTVLLCSMLLASLPAAHGQPWPRFRGPNGLGESDATTIPVTWTGSDYDWKVALPGSGDSSPVVWGNRVYVTSGNEDDATRFVSCLSISNGDTVWQRSFPSTTFQKNALGSYATATPALDADRVYASWTTPEAYTVVALDRDKGTEVWRRDLGPFVAQHGFGASPIVFRDMLIVPDDQDAKSFVIALRAKTGETCWQVDRGAETASYSTPCVYQPEGGAPQLILTSASHGISALDPATGRTIWELKLLEKRVVGSPTIASGLIIAGWGQGSGGKRVVAVRAADPAKGVEAKMVYEFQGSLPYVPTPVAYGRLVFLWSDTGVVTCADAPTGKIHWRERIGGKFFGSPVRVGERIYCMSCAGEMVVLAAAEKYQLLSKFDLGERTQSTPAVSDGVMYLRTASHLMAIGGKKK